MGIPDHEFIESLCPSPSWVDAATRKGALNRSVEHLLDRRQSLDSRLTGNEQHQTSDVLYEHLENQTCSERHTAHLQLSGFASDARETFFTMFLSCSKNEQQQSPRTTHHMTICTLDEYALFSQDNNRMKFSNKHLSGQSHLMPRHLSTSVKRRS